MFSKDVPMYIYIQAVKLSVDPFFRGFLVITEISVNLVRNLKSCMGGGVYLRNYLAHRNVYLSKRDPNISSIDAMVSSPIRLQG